ncbi:MAG: class I SAM-dependent methyltransferase [Chloroflexi bacterium]|jgi:ubiquinone/menaquinone biosynthesis C-methylase UbiE|nr:class I SAM-dependent methyltransferase [Chloroflexota bacterium]
MRKDELFFFAKQTLALNAILTPGLILDIAGGGEGVIAQLMGDRVIAIDKKLRELTEAPVHGLKIQMDAAHLSFPDESFHSVTVFFGFMFMPMRIHSQVLKEIYRVLKAGGGLYLWDVDVEKPDSTDKQGFAFYLDVHLPDRLIQTGYGFYWPPKAQTSRYYLSLLEETGFREVGVKQSGLTFAIETRKPV